MVRMDIQTVVMGGLHMSSLIVLKKQAGDGDQVHLPIRIGPVEAAAITAGIEGTTRNRPLTHDLMGDLMESLGARLVSVDIVDVQGTTFFAKLQIVKADGTTCSLDCRPSDAIALAVRKQAPIFARKQVIETATMPDFQKVKETAERQELDAFHDFVEGLSPEDFA